MLPRYARYRHSKDSRVDRCISRFSPGWMRELVLQDIRASVTGNGRRLSD